MSADSPFDPENRELYTALVRAPDGYSFGHAVATTYSLDFETALTIPISIVFRDAENRDEMLRSPLALLQSVERMADRIAVYCDRGRIKEANPKTARLMALYEKTIVEVAAPGGGAFHPKLWCIRFEPQKKTDPVRMRVAILSRNLTNDRCWDLALALDGTVHEGKNDDNHALTKLLRTLPNLTNPATRPAPPKYLASLISDLERTRWEDLPAGATKVRFAVNGLDGDGWVLPHGEKLAVLSPFVTAPVLERLAKGYGSKENRQLISRAEELDGIDPEIRDRFSISTLDERATEYEEGAADEPNPSDLEGLHAKVYLVEKGSRLQIHTGSANATTAATVPTKGGRTRNVEVMATLDGPKTRMGTIDQALFSEAFQRLLASYTPKDPPTLDEAVKAEKKLEEMRAGISALPLDLCCSEVGDLIQLELQLATKDKHVLLPDGVRCFVRAITIPNEQGYDLSRLLSGSDTELALGAVPLGDVTRWLGIRLLHEKTQVAVTFTLGARLVGVPEGRDAAILRAHIENADNFLHYLRMLLGTLGEGSFLESDTGGDGQWLRSLGDGKTSLLEPMVRALNLESGELEEIGRLIERLGDPASDKTVVPKEFLTLWKSFEPLVTRKRGRK